MNRVVIVVIAVVAAVVVAALTPRAAVAEEIKAILVDENTKTSDDTVLLIADVEVGDDFNFEMLDEIRVRLVSSELFKEVNVFSEPWKGGQRLTILARDKHSWIIAPTFYNQPGNRGGGVGFAEANLFGKNKKLLLYAQYATADSFFIGGYIDPAIAGSRFKWQVDTFLRKEEVSEYARPAGLTDTVEPVRVSDLRYLNGGMKVGFHLFRAFSFDVRLRGAHVKWSNATLAVGATCADVADPADLVAVGQCDDATGEAPIPGTSGWDVSTEYIRQIDRRANWYGIRTGNRYKLSYEQSQPALGSDFEYWYAGLGGFWGSRGHLLEDDNLIIEGGIKYGQDVPMQHEFTSGGVGLRGYRNREFRGDFKADWSIEYSVPMFTIKSLSFRALGFYDGAYTDFFDKDFEQDDFRHYLPDEGTDFGPLKNGVGGGIRIYFRSIVVPLLGFDVAYGLEGGEMRTYFAVGLTEL